MYAHTCDRSCRRGCDRDEMVRRARAVCDACPVSQQCLEYALDHEEDLGIWGGLTEWQRRYLHRTEEERRR